MKSRDYGINSDEWLFIIQVTTEKVEEMVMKEEVFQGLKDQTRIIVFKRMFKKAKTKLPNGNCLRELMTISKLEILF